MPTHRTRSHLLAPVRTCPHQTAPARTCSHLFAPDDAIVVDVDASASRPSEFDDRFRLYLDESGDHVFREVVEPAHRFLCLLGCWFQNPAYLRFSDELETLKRKFLPHHPDNPVVLHREDMLNARREFKSLRDPAIRAAWDKALLDVIDRADFRIVAVVIDKLALRSAYGDDAAHPYHLALGFMLQRYAGYLNHINRVGDVMAEARGGVEDRRLKDSHVRAFEQGAWSVGAGVFQRALTSRELKLKTKGANIAGLQLADLLGHPVKNLLLMENGLLEGPQPGFAQRLSDAVSAKFNRHIYDGRVNGYGKVLFPDGTK